MFEHIGKAELRNTVNKNYETSIFKTRQYRKIELKYGRKKGSICQFLIKIFSKARKLSSEK